MNKSLLNLVLVMPLTFALFLPTTAQAISVQSLGPGKMNYVIASSEDIRTVDPALAYDKTSCEMIRNVYDTLIFPKGTDYVQWLADSYSISPDGQTYTFHIRPNVPWQNAYYLFVEPEDVEYSFERVLVRDYTGGPAWMLWYPIFGLYSATDFGDLGNHAVAVELGNLIENAITHDDVARTVTIHFQTGHAYPPFLGILAGTWGSVMNRNWAIYKDDWTDTGLDDGTWVQYRDPLTSPLDAHWGPGRNGFMMGSGPFEFNYWNVGIAWSMIRNGGQDGSVPGTVADPTPTTAFWGGWNTDRLNILGFTGAISRGYVDSIDAYVESRSWVRLPGLWQGPLCDTTEVPILSIGSVWQRPGIKSIYPLHPLTVEGLFFSYDAGIDSPYIGSPTGYGYFGENGITPNFFSDIHARKAVAYSLDWAQFLANAYFNEARQVAIPLPDTLPFYNGSVPKYSMDIDLAKNEWKLAWGGTLESPGPVWANGFRFYIVYDGDNQQRFQVANMLKARLESENPKFHVDLWQVPNIAYNVVFNSDGRARAPLFQVTVPADYPDADSFTRSFLSSSSGGFGWSQHIEMDPYSAQIDNLIQWGAHNATVEGRNANYQRLWQIYHDEVPSVPLDQPYGRRWARDWVHGWTSVLPDNYGYTLWKENIHASSGTFAGKSADWEDINEDGKVDVKDMATASKAFGAYFIQPILPPNPQPPPPPGSYSANWDSRVDLNVVDPGTGARGDMKVDIRDLATMSPLFGFVADAWTPGP